MGSSDSTPVTVSLERVNLYYTHAVNHNYVPDVGIDESLWKFSFADSNVALQEHLSENLAQANGAHQLPGYVKDVGQALAPITKAPNAVGLAAVVISVLLDVLLGQNQAAPPSDVPAMLQRIFNNEKSNAILVTMDDYIKQHQIHIHNPPLLKQKARLAAQELSKQLTALRHVMMGGDMKSKYLKHWVNGAAFHVLLLAHIANMRHTECGDCSAVDQKAASNAVNIYLGKLHVLLDKYKEYKLQTIGLGCHPTNPGDCGPQYGRPKPLYLGSLSWLLVMYDHELKGLPLRVACLTSECTYEYGNMYEKEFVNRMFLSPGQIAGLTTYFTDLRSNLTALVTSRAVFHVPTCREVRRTYPYVDCY